MEQYVIGLDYGNTNLKATAFDTLGVQRAVSVVPGAPTGSLHPGWAEQDMDEVWSRMCSAIHGLWKQGIDPAGVLGIGISGFGGGAFLIDREGRPVRAIITSTDSRVSQDPRFRPIQDAMDVDAMGGKPSNPSYLLRWVKEFEPENYERIAWDMMSKDFIRFKLTGEVHAEASDLGTNVFVSKPSMTYSKKVFELLGVPEMLEKMPPFIASWEVGGRVTPQAAAESGFKAGTPVVGGGHDCVAASVGIGIHKKGQLSASLGTFAVNLMMAGDAPTAFPKDHPVRNCPSMDPRRWMFINQAHVGKAMDWFVNTLGRAEKAEAQASGTSVFEIMNRKAASVERTKLLYLPYVAALRDTPIKAAHMGFYGATADTGFDELVRAAYEGIAFSEVYMLKLMAQSVQPESLAATGGGAKNELQCRILADLLDIPVTVPDVEESACRGAALAAAIGAGLYKDFAETAALPVGIRKRYEPNPAEQEYFREKYDAFLRLTDAALGAGV